MIKRLARWLLKNELVTEEYAMIVSDRFCDIESKIYLLQSLADRNQSQMKNLREDMKLLQTRQVDILNRMQRIER